MLLRAFSLSLGQIADPAFRSAVERFVEDERRQTQHEMQFLAEGSPFRQTD